MKVITILAFVVLALIVLGWLGLQITPLPFRAFPQPASRRKTVPLRDGLPGPVEHFYHQIYGENVPLIESAVMTGRAKMRVRGLTFPGRFRFVHHAGQGYHRYIETTIFTYPLITINESYLDGKSRLELPSGVTEGKPKVDQGANLA